ncbi:MAG TPA: hypothetical protein PL054_05780 [Clostridia bacterium]|nr:MAG: hypothetical protein BWX97_01294 [Firmicutes bacterium ADurb.Bin146]HOD93364.1 hypothetical protein [Clostridia bacterium]
MFKKSKYDDDDGRVIAPMNVEGMPWYLKNVRQKNVNNERSHPLSTKETISVTLYAILAGITVALIIGLFGFLFILFCIHVWFR